MTAVPGCNKLASTPIPESVPDPAYRGLIANYLKTTFKSYSSYEVFEILEPCWVHSFQGWLTCVRFVDRDRRRTYVLVLNGTNIVDAHYAVQTDDCGAQILSSNRWGAGDWSRCTRAASMARALRGSKTEFWRFS
jgi:hypothetical protein